MRKNFDAALKKLKRKRHSYSAQILRVLLFPIWVIVLIKNEIYESIYRSTQWSDSRTTRILDKVLPYEVEICDDELCYCTEWRNPWSTGNRLHFSDKIYGRKFNYEILRYLETMYQIDGYKKRLESPSGFERWIVFSRKNNFTKEITI